MALLEINRHPAARELRWFGVLLAVFIALAGGLAQWRFEMPVAAWAAWVAGAVLVGFHASPPALRRRIYLGWLYAAYPIGWTTLHLALAAVYFAVVTPIGLALRLTRGDPLERTPDRPAASYWTPRQPRGDVRRYFRQF